MPPPVFGPVDARVCMVSVPFVSGLFGFYHCNLGALSSTTMASVELFRRAHVCSHP